MWFGCMLSFTNYVLNVILTKLGLPKKNKKKKKRRRNCASTHILESIQEFNKNLIFNNNNILFTDTNTPTHTHTDMST